MHTVIVTLKHHLLSTKKELKRRNSISAFSCFSIKHPAHYLAISGIHLTELNLRNYPGLFRLVILNTVVNPMTIHSRINAH